MAWVVWDDQRQLWVGEDWLDYHDTYCQACEQNGLGMDERPMLNGSLEADDE